MEFEPLVKIGKTGKFFINFCIQWRKSLNWLWCHWEGIISNFSAPNVITAIQFGAENGQNENELFELEKIKNAFQRKKATINVGGNGFSAKKIINYMKGIDSVNLTCDQSIGH